LVFAAADFLNTLGRDLENGDKDGKGDRSDRGGFFVLIVGVDVVVFRCVSSLLWIGRVWFLESDVALV
jgi:hypothetical protein